MIISTIIHGLEVATVMLVGLMAYQIFKCYRNYKASSEAKGEQSASVNSVIDSEEVLVAPEREAQTQAHAQVSEPESASNAILNDYIGEFFGSSETSSADIQAYKAVTQPAYVAPEEAQNQPEAITVSKEQLASFKAPETIEPILVNPVRVVDLDEEDTFIVVEDDSIQTHNKNANVMSDKVVHAMLEEANLAAS